MRKEKLEWYKEHKKELWNNPRFRAFISARQYMSRFCENDSEFDIYYSEDSKTNLIKVGLTQNIKERCRAFDNALADGEYISIRHFTDLKEAVLCEAFITINFYEGNKEYYSAETFEKIKKFVEEYDYSSLKETDFSKKLFDKEFKNERVLQRKEEKENKKREREKEVLRKALEREERKIKEREKRNERILLKEKEKIEKERKRLEELEHYKEEGKVDSIGRINPSILPEEVWNERLELIKNSGIDLEKFGSISKLSRKIGLTRRVIVLTLEHFKLK